MCQEALALLSETPEDADDGVGMRQLSLHCRVLRALLLLQRGEATVLQQTGMPPMLHKIDLPTLKGVSFHQHWST